VVLKREINYYEYVFLREHLEVKTQIESIRDARSVWIVEFLNIKKRIAKASVEWCLIQALTMKPHRISEAIVNIFKEK